LRVDPGNQDSSFLVTKLTLAAVFDPNFGSRMPLGKPPLDAAQIERSVPGSCAAHWRTNPATHERPTWQGCCRGNNHPLSLQGKIRYPQRVQAGERGVRDSMHQVFVRSCPPIAGIIALTLFGPALAARATVAAPEITATAWLNSAPVRLADLKGQVALVEFWTFGCYNCRNVEPHVQEWHRKYSTLGLVVIGVHTPETAYERDVGNVERYIRDHNISYPVAIDSDFMTWQRYSNAAWPAWYLIDKRGIVRYAHVGEGAYAETVQQMEMLLAEKGHALVRAS